MAIQLSLGFRTIGVQILSCLHKTACKLTEISALTHKETKTTAGVKFGVPKIISELNTGLKKWNINLLSQTSCNTRDLQARFWNPPSNPSNLLHEEEGKDRILKGGKLKKKKGRWKTDIYFTAGQWQTLFFLHDTAHLCLPVPRKACTSHYFQ